MKYAVLFPGQGSQFVGMGADVFAKRPDLLGDAATQCLGWSLVDLCSRGPEDDLTATDKAQPALYATGFALWDEFARQVSVPPVAAAGHSLGEYTALAASGALSYLTGLELVSERGAAMAAAAAMSPSGMAALIGADVETAEAACVSRRDQGGRLWVANINAPGQVVVAGGAADIEWLGVQGKDLGVRRVIPLKVAGAFHSPYMTPAADRLRVALAAADFGEPAFDVYTNVAALPVRDHRGALADQLTGTVRFSETLQNMAAHGVEAFVHVGVGDVTAGMAKRSVDGAVVYTVSSLADIGEVAAAVSVQ